MISLILSLEIRDYKVRYFENIRKEILMNAIWNALKDEAYSIVIFDSVHGIVNAQRVEILECQYCADTLYKISPSIFIGFSTLACIISNLFAIPILTFAGYDDELAFLLYNVGCIGYFSFNYCKCRKELMKCEIESIRIRILEVHLEDSVQGYKVLLKFKIKTFDENGQVMLDDLYDMKLYEDFFLAIERYIKSE